MFLAVKCQNSPCWGPTPPPGWAWLLFVAVAIVAGLIILADWKTSASDRRRARNAIFIWLASLVLIAVSAEALELYRYSITPR